MPKLPINEIIATMKGSQGSARPRRTRTLDEQIDAPGMRIGPRGGVTRRDVLEGAADQMMPKGDAIESVLNEAELASGFFKQNPDLWDPSWGPLEEAEPEDLVDAMQSVLEVLRGGLEG